MTAVVLFVLGVVFVVELVFGLSTKRDSTGTYTGELINQLIATVDRAFRRKRLSP
jgi:hypothetical protein